MHARPIVPPEDWSLIVPMSIASGEPLLARDRRPADSRRRDRLAVRLVAALTAAAGLLAAALAL
ncbi:MAG TPA: hypothetical protein VM734_05410 [Kofleriaceae bacterium]|jgi:hypothetical protein|nr:hypothetical protein [Kofleriaceae bacterium]